jgi:glycosyltransferase involved in cell wall biosynthesis
VTRAARASGAPAVRVAVVSPEPTPYRSPLFDRIARRPEIALTVIYAASTVARRTWVVRPRHRALILHGHGIPGATRVLRHDYPLTAGVPRALVAANPHCVVVSGWSTFASQRALAWCRRRRVPYVLIVESHDAGVRAPWRRVVKSAVVPPIVRRAAGVLVVGSLARESMVARGARPEQVRIFANTIDVAVWSERSDRLAAERPRLRESLGLGPDDVAVLSVARLAPEKGLDLLLRGAAAAGDPHLVVAIAGSGPQEGALRRLAAELGVRLSLLGDVPWQRIAETYIAADVFALLSHWEPWGVVVNEAAACGLPLVLSDQVGAAPDLLVDGQNGVLVADGSVAEVAAALRRYAADPAARQAAGADSRRLVAGWGYEPSVESFVTIVCEAAGLDPSR